MATRPDSPRILHVSTIAVTLERFIAPIAARLRERGWQIDAAASGAGSSRICSEAFDACHEVRFRRNVFSSANLMAGRRDIARLAREGNYQIVHVHTPIASFVTRFALRKRPADQKLVYTAHGFHFFDGASWLRNRFFAGIERVAAPWMDHLVVINRQDQRNAVRFGLATPANMTFMQGIGVDPGEFTPPADPDRIRRDKRRELGIGEDEFVFLKIAGYTANKRHCDVVRALALLPPAERGRVLFAGAGDLLEATRKLAVELQVADRIHFLGYRTDIAELLVACDAVVLVSVREGLPRSVMEALAMGKRVIGSDARGTSDLLADGCGVIVPSRNPQALARAMQTIREFVPDREQIRSTLEACSLPRIIAQHDRLYRDLAGRGPEPGPGEGAGRNWQPEEVTH